MVSALAAALHLICDQGGLGQLRLPYASCLLLLDVLVLLLLLLLLLVVVVVVVVVVVIVPVLGFSTLALGTLQSSTQNNPICRWCTSSTANGWRGTGDRVTSAFAK